MRESKKYSVAMKYHVCNKNFFQHRYDLWMIDEGKVHMTEELLGEGAYGDVKVAIFRGLRVAVKSLHPLIISPYNLALFTREMNMASRIHHPNLVPLQGATERRFITSANHY